MIDSDGRALSPKGTQPLSKTGDLRNINWPPCSNTRLPRAVGRSVTFSFVTSTRRPPMVSIFNTGTVRSVSLEYSERVHASQPNILFATPIMVRAAALVFFAEFSFWPSRANHLDRASNCAVRLRRSTNRALFCPTLSMPRAAIGLRQRKIECRTRIDSTFCPGSPGVPLDNSSHARQPQAAAGEAALWVEALERAEQFCGILLIKTDAVVPNKDDPFVLSFAGGDFNGGKFART